MIPVALLLALAVAVVVGFGVKILWNFYHGSSRVVELEKKVEALRQALDDLLIGDVPKEDVRALLRRYFDSKRA